MYKALNVQDNSEVVILDPKWFRVIDQLRTLDRQNLLVCQGCKQPVRVRAGEQNREHFAHKHLHQCTYADESSVLQNCRAVLYKWLVGKFGENVTIEKKVDGLDLLRPIDCWVTKNSKVFAYWIIDSQIKPEKRSALKFLANQLGIQFHWVFAYSMLRVNQDSPNQCILSTTEREFIQESKYDAVFSGYHSAMEGTLHYLDAENKKLTTFRSLSIYHGPQIHKGHSISSDLDTILVSPQNGEFVHNGEYENLQSLQANLHLTGTSGKTSEKPDPSIPLSPEIGMCTSCGELTKDWWDYDGKTGLCKCRICLEQGNF